VVFSGLRGALTSRGGAAMLSRGVIECCFGPLVIVKNHARPDGPTEFGAVLRLDEGCAGAIPGAEPRRPAPDLVRIREPPERIDAGPDKIGCSKLLAASSTGSSTTTGKAGWTNATKRLLRPTSEVDRRPHLIRPFEDCLRGGGWVWPTRAACPPSNEKDHRRPGAA